MSSNIRTSRALARAVLVAVAATLALAGALMINSSPAHAVRTVTVDGLSDSPAEVENLQVLELEGSGFTAGRYVFVSVCNTTLGGNFGTHCDYPLLELVQVAQDGTWSLEFNVHSSFTDYNSQTGLPLSPGHFTVCNSVAGANGQCALQMVEYATDPPSGPPSGLVSIPLSFS